MNSLWALGLRVSGKSAARVHTRHFSYSLPTIPLLDNLKVNSQAFQGLFSTNTLNQLWFQRGDKLVSDLNHLLIQNKITPPADLNELISLTFNKPELHGIYSYASILHNLQFFLESLKPSSAEVAKADASELLRSPIVEEDVQGPSDEQLKAWIVDSFGSMSEFKTLLLNSAKGIKGDGISWLVAQPSLSESTLKGASFAASRDEGDAKYTKLVVINTYNAGIVDDSIRSGQINKLKQQKAAKEASETEPPKDQRNDTVLGSVEEAEFNALYQDRKIVPLLAIDASMRNYLLDYGVFGKQRYLQNVWNCIDWDVVAKRSPPRFKQSFEINF